VIEEERLNFPKGRENPAGRTIVQPVAAARP